MASFKDRVIRFIVLGALICGVAFNSWVISSCEFLESSSDELQVGVFRYSLVSEGNDDYQTNGECQRYDNKASDGYVRTAQVSAILALCFGLLLIVLIGVTQHCFQVPCSGIVIALAYIGAQLCTALIWLLYRTDVCNGCDWGDAASANVLAQIMYFIAAVFHKCMPTPKELAAQRKADKAESKAADAEQKQKESEEKLRATEEKNAEAEMTAGEAQNPGAEADKTLVAAQTV